MTINLPKDPDNITGAHVERAIEHAKRLFARYEAWVDFSWPQERIDELYRPYQLAAEQAKMLARHQNYLIEEAERLP